MALFTRKSSTPPPEGPRVEGQIGDLFDEIAAATQQRRYTATVGAVEVVFDTSNREVVAIISVAPADFPGADAVKIKMRDDDELAGQLATYGALFAALAAVPGKLLLTSVAAPLRYSTKLQGFSKEELTRATLAALKARSDAPVPAEVVVAAPVALPSAQVIVAAEATGDTLFYNQIMPVVRAALVVDWGNRLLARHGEIGELEGLRGDILHDFAEWQAKVDPVIHGQKLMVMRSGQASDAMFCAHLDVNAVTLITCPGAALGRILAVMA